MQHYTIIVSGKVQGVFFRASTREQAERLNVRGWVKNEADGSVRIEAEGQENELRTLTAWCQQGPPQSEVTQVTVYPGKVENYSDFTIRH